LQTTVTSQDTGNSFVKNKRDIPARTNKACFTIGRDIQIGMAA
jgi:hypothetical protein